MHKLSSAVANVYKVLGPLDVLVGAWLELVDTAEHWYYQTAEAQGAFYHQREEYLLPALRIILPRHRSKQQIR
jgi:hypothetical protein